MRTVQRDEVAAPEVAFDRRQPRGQYARALVQRAGTACVDRKHPGGGQTAAQPRLARAGIGLGQEQRPDPGIKRAPDRGGMRAIDDGERDSRPLGDAGCLKLGEHPARTQARGRLAAGHGDNLGCDPCDLLDQRGTGLARVAVVQTVDIGEQQDSIGPGGLRNARGKPVVIAEADFLGRDAVVLIDHRQCACLQQPGEGGRGIEIASAILEIA